MLIFPCLKKTMFSGPGFFTGNETIKIKLEIFQKAIAPEQGMIFYNIVAVPGGGWIKQNEKR